MNELKFNRNLKELLNKLANDNKSDLNELLRKLHKHGSSSEELKAFELLLKCDHGGNSDRVKGVNSSDIIINNYACLLQNNPSGFGPYKSTKLNKFNDKEADELFKTFNDVLHLRLLLNNPQNTQDILNISTYNHLSDTIILNALDKSVDSEYKYKLTSHAINHSKNVDIYLRHLQMLLTHPPTSISEFLYKTYSLLSKHLTTPKSGHYNTQILQFQQSMLDIWVVYKKPLSLIPIINDLLISAQSLSFLSQANFRCLFYLNRDTSISADLATRSFVIYHQLALKSRQTDAKNVNIQLRTLHNDETINEDTIMDLDGDDVYYQTIFDAIPLLLSQSKLDLAKEVVNSIEVGNKDSFYANKVYLQSLLLAHEAEYHPEPTTRETLFGNALESTHASLALTPTSIPTLKLHARLCDQIYNVSDGINALRTVLKNDPNDWDAWLHMSNLLSATDHAGALSVVRSAIDLSEATSAQNDPLAPETVTSIERAHRLMKLLILENVLVEATEGADAALEGQINLFSYFSNQIWKSARFSHVLEEFRFGHPSERAGGGGEDALSYPLKGSASEGALNQHLQLRSNASVVSYTSQGSQGSAPSTQSSSQTKRRSKLHVPYVPHPHISVSGALGRLRRPKQARSVNGVNGVDGVDTNKVLPRIRVSSVPHDDSTTTTQQSSQPPSQAPSQSKPPVDVSDYDTRECSLLAWLWLMSAATYRRLRDYENAAHALHMAEEASPSWGVYVELARQCAEQQKHKLANTSLIKAQFLSNVPMHLPAEHSERCYQISEYEYASFLFNLGVDGGNEEVLHPNITTGTRLDAVEGLLESLLTTAHHISRQCAGAHYMLAMCYKSRNRSHKLKSCLEAALRVDRSVGVLSIDALDF